MRASLILQAFLVLIALGCDSFTINQPKEPAARNRFKINDAGDTVMMIYHENGKLSSEIIIKNRMKNGLAVNYYENGEIKNEIPYKDNLKEGRVTWNYESGALYRESTYVHDEIEGIQTRYYEDGKLMAEIPYKSGKVLTGTKEYSKEGKLKTHYPEIQFEAIDKLAFENKYFLHLSLSKKDLDAKFFKVTEINGTIYDIPIEIKGEMAELSWYLPKGDYIMEKVTVAAEYYTVLNNPVRLEKTYNLAIENR
jgi:hypothetical protein